MRTPSELLEQIGETVGARPIDGRINVDFRWDNFAEAKAVLGRLSTMLRALKLVRQELSIISKDIRRVHRGKLDFVDKLASEDGPLFGSERQISLQVDADSRRRIRVEQQEALAPYGAIGAAVEAIDLRLRSIQTQVRSSPEYLNRPTSLRLARSPTRNNSSGGTASTHPKARESRPSLHRTNTERGGHDDAPRLASASVACRTYHSLHSSGIHMPDPLPSIVATRKSGMEPLHFDAQPVPSRPRHMHIGTKIKELRRRAGLRNVDVAKACEVTPGAVSNWVKTGRISKEHLSVFASLIGVSSDQIINSEPDEIIDLAGQPLRQRSVPGTTEANASLSSAALELAWQFDHLSRDARQEVLLLLLRLAPGVAPNHAGD